jgi:hypothetical protein
MDFAGCRFEQPAINKLASVLPAASSLQVKKTSHPRIHAALSRERLLTTWTDKSIAELDHRPQGLKCSISLCTKPVSVLSVPVQTVR